MRKRWLFFTVIACLSLVVASCFLAARSSIPLQITETNGFRNFTVRRAGLFPVGKAIRAPGLDVTADAKVELKRLGLAMPTKGAEFLETVSHSFQKESQVFQFHGRYPGSPKEAYRDFSSWFGRVSRHRRPDSEQVFGTTPGKKASLYFTATLDRGVTFVNIGLGKPWSGEFKSVELP